MEEGEQQESIQEREKEEKVWIERYEKAKVIRKEKEEHERQRRDGVGQYPCGLKMCPFGFYTKTHHANLHMKEIHNFAEDDPRLYETAKTIHACTTTTTTTTTTATTTTPPPPRGENRRRIERLLRNQGYFATKSAPSDADVLHASQHSLGLDQQRTARLEHERTKKRAPLTGRGLEFFLMLEQIALHKRLSLICRND